MGIGLDSRRVGPAAASVVGVTRSAAIAQLARFGVVGVSNTVLTLVAYDGGLRAGLTIGAAGAVSYLLGGINGFVANRRWTFHHDGPVLGSALRYGIVALAGVAANVLLLHLAVHGLGVPRRLGELTAVPPVTVLTFACSRAWAFAPRPASVLHVEAPPAGHPAPARRVRRDGAARVRLGWPRAAGRV